MKAANEVKEGYRWSIKRPAVTVAFFVQEVSPGNDRKEIVRSKKAP
jgi:hypothetical protein